MICRDQEYEYANPEEKSPGACLRTASLQSGAWHPSWHPSRSLRGSTGRDGCRCGLVIDHLEVPPDSKPNVQSGAWHVSGQIERTVDTP